MIGRLTGHGSLHLCWNNGSTKTTKYKMVFFCHWFILVNTWKLFYCIQCSLQISSIICFFFEFQLILLEYIEKWTLLKMSTCLVSLYCVHHVKRLFWGETISAITHCSNRFLQECFELISPEQRWAIFLLLVFEMEIAPDLSYWLSC